MFSVMYIIQSSNELFAWDYNNAYDSSSIKIIIIDSQNRSDSATMVFHGTATIGIDSIYGEINLLGTPYNDPEIRVIQKQKAPYKSLQNIFNLTGSFPLLPDSMVLYPGNWNHLYFADEETELKTDNRPFTASAFCFPVYKINATSFPVTVILRRSGFLSHSYILWDKVIIKDDWREWEDGTGFGWKPLEYFYYIPLEGRTDTIFTINSQEELGEFSWIALCYYSKVDVQEPTITYNPPLYPNPSNNVLNIKNQSNEEIIIYDMSGKIIRSVIPNHQEIKIDISSYPIGMYLIRIGSQTYKFVKR